MVSVSESTAETLQELASEFEKELERVQETFSEKYSDIESQSEGMDQSAIEKIALRATKTNLSRSSRVPTDEVELLTIGGSVREWSDGDTFVGRALVDRDPESDVEDFRISTVIANEGVEVPEIYEAFEEVGNVVRGEFSVSEADVGNFLVLNSSEDTVIDVTKPDDRSGFIEIIRDEVPQATIADISDHLAATERNEDGDTYPVAFGVDICRIEADIYDGYKNPDDGVGMYTVRDETVFDEEDVKESPVFNEEEANENAVPGLTCFTDPNKMVYGSDSICEFIGTLTEDENGQIQMNVDAIMPVYDAGDFDGYTDENDDDEMPEENVPTTNVDTVEV